MWKKQIMANLIIYLETNLKSTTRFPNKSNTDILNIGSCHGCQQSDDKNKCNAGQQQKQMSTLGITCHMGYQVQWFLYNQTRIIFEIQNLAKEKKAWDIKLTCKFICSLLKSFFASICSFFLFIWSIAAFMFLAVYTKSDFFVLVVKWLLTIP